VPRQRTRKSTPTIRDVAERAGVSTAAASYALRGERGAAATVERVERAADELGYRGNPMARALRTGRTGTVAVIGGSLDDLWHQEFVSRVARHLHGAGMRAILADSAGDPARERELAAELAGTHADGVLVLPVGPAGADWADVAAGVPVIAVGTALPAPAASIRFATGPAVRAVHRHLAGLGHARILALSPRPPIAPPPRGVRMLECGYAGSAGFAAATEALAEPNPPTAIIALSDTLAYGALHACRDLGLDVPGDVSVAGFDDLPLSTLVAPALTSVGWDTPAVAERAAGMLVRALRRRRRPRGTTVEGELVVRASTGPVVSPRGPTG
jgi:LacI family transcriptional regulator